MTTIHKKLIVAGTALLGAIGYLAYAGVQSGWVYSVDVDQAMSAPANSQRVRLHGKVGEADFTANPGLLQARFLLVGKTQSVPVQYKGTIPDLFAAGKDVVVEGRFRDGTFEADLLMTKCASKYESKSPHARAGKVES
jgi:cytochrome c-type biogenesis protein CcmE